MSTGGWGSDWPAMTTPKTYEQGIADGERRATERIVAYLRRESYPCCNQCNNQLADYIERGEHRREER